MSDTKLTVDAIAGLQAENILLSEEKTELKIKLEKIRQIVNTAKEHRLTLDSQDIQAICEVLEDE